MTTSTAATISINGLTKTFGPVRALDELDLNVAAAEVHGFLGPNGSGKTTTIRVLLGTVAPGRRRGAAARR
jgi:ABC-2 type transport system ATP-binding protein